MTAVDLAARLKPFADKSPVARDALRELSARPDLVEEIALAVIQAFAAHDAWREELATPAT